jgi:hypothetical protein
MNDSFRMSRISKCCPEDDALAFDARASDAPNRNVVAVLTHCRDRREAQQHVPFAGSLRAGKKDA